MALDDLRVQIDSLKAELAALPPLKSGVEQCIREKFRLEWNYHSNAIEGNAFTRGETKSLLLEGLLPGGTRRLRHVDDLRGHDRAVRFIEAFAATREPVSERVLRQLHALLVGDEYSLETLNGEGEPVLRQVVPGQLRTAPAWVRTASGELFEFATPSSIAGRLAEFLRGEEDYERAPKEHPVIHAARSHHRFLALYPFEDGNGRLGRILMNLALLRRGFPPVIIHKEDRRAYLAALRHADAGDMDELVSLIARSLIEAQSLALRGARGELIEDADDVDKALLSLKQELASVEEPQELTPERFARVLTTSVGPLVIRLVEKLRQFDELYSGEKLAISCQVFSDPAFQVTAPGPAMSARKSQTKKWLAEIPAAMVMSEMQVTFSWEGFRKGGLNDFGTNLTLRFQFEKRKFHIECEALPYSRRLMYQQQLPEEESRQFLNAVAMHILSQIQVELERQKK